MARQSIGGEQAFNILRRASQNRNQKLHDVAGTIVQSVTGGVEPT